jgi:hypothetical protein
MSLSYRLLVNGVECPGVLAVENLATAFGGPGLGMATGRRQYQPLVIRKMWESAATSPFAKWSIEGEKRDYSPSKHTIVLEVAELGVRYTLSGCLVAAYQPLLALSEIDATTAKGIQEKGIQENGIQGKGINQAGIKHSASAGEALTVRFQSLAVESFTPPPVYSPNLFDHFWNFITMNGR